MEKLRAALEEMDIKPRELATLLGVTARAVNMWLDGTRKVPGPVWAYLRLLRRLPPRLRQSELVTLRKW